MQQSVLTALFFLFFGFSPFFLARSKPTTQRASSRPSTLPVQKPHSIRHYYPLSVGNRWTYVLEDATSKRKKTNVVRIVRKKSGVFFDNRGGSYRHTPLGFLNSSQYMLKYPLSKGARWRTMARGKTTVFRRIVATTEKVRVPAGEFKSCLVVHNREKFGLTGIFESLVIYAPKVGVVKVLVYVTNRGQRSLQWTLQLTSYKLR